MSLQNIIANHDAHSLDWLSKQSLDRHVHKLAKAAQGSFARGALQQDQIKFLLTVNNEAKARRTTTSTVLGRAKVMSFEDLVVARANKAEKEAAKENMKTEVIHRKRKLAKPEADILSPKVTRIGEAPEEARATAQLSQTQVRQDGNLSDTWRPTVARMW
ncbi:hypothetical protein LTR12_014718 [Friedmanniomyces endolithicus]|nr:hypothetical protein LTR12_014718 [Friedmanniomyces endolithicus]